MTGGGSKQYQHTLAGIPFVIRVLVDTGANEIIRPHNPDWWNEIIKREKGQPATLKLAGGVMTNKRGAVTQY
eukprot:9027314-Prorocentrum_lima.AAC.1